MAFSLSHWLGWGIEGASREELEAAIEGLVLESAELMGTYER